MMSEITDLKFTVRVDIVVQRAAAHGDPQLHPLGVLFGPDHDISFCGVTAVHQEFAVFLDLLAGGYGHQDFSHGKGRKADHQDKRNKHAKSAFFVHPSEHGVSLPYLIRLQLL